MESFVTSRRTTTKVAVGTEFIGGDAPIVVQSMATSATTDIDGSVQDALSIAEAGGRIVRYTAASVSEAKALGEIKNRLRAAGCDIPIVADVHFNPQAAFTAAQIVEKVRINPGNFIDARAKFEIIDYTDKEYNAEIARLETEFRKLLAICRSNGTAIRIGVNHGSLSDRIMSRYGDTVNGMCESAMEFLRVCKKDNFNNVVVSMKSSNVAVMVEAYREIVLRMQREEM
ncbi:MAG: flavodoxin-dependent (E)-4-hydroxy-3-methylbut-2-enyl-diphosphate synthase, partial [Rikenellaceae bacterium]